MTQLPASELSAWLADGARKAPLLLDVREPWEYEICRIPGSRLMPMGSIGASLESIDDSLPIVCICHHGARSLQVAFALERQGMREVYNLAGGLAAWARQVDPTMATY